MRTLCTVFIAALALPIGLVAADSPVAGAWSLSGWHQVSPDNDDAVETLSDRRDTLVLLPGALSSTGDIHAFDVDHHTWLSLSPLPSPRDNPMFAIVSGQVLLFGGMESDETISDDTWLYDAQRQSWTSLSEMPEPRAAGSVVVVDDLVYIVGGIGGNNRVLRYDPMQDAWRRLSELDVERAFPAAVALDDTIYITGGRDASAQDMSSAIAYDINADAWTPIPAMIEARSMHAAVVVEDQIAVLGGERAEAGEGRRSIELWAPPGEDGWTAAGQLPRALGGIASVHAGGFLYVLGDTHTLRRRPTTANVLVATIRHEAGLMLDDLQ